MRIPPTDIPLVLIHGYPFDHTLWYSTIAALGAGVKVLTPDLPGFGRTEVLDSEPSVEALAEWLAQWLDEKKVGSLVLVGMSMGGYVGLAFAEKYATRLRGFGLVSSQAGADSAEARKNRATMIEKIRKQGPGVAAEALIPKLYRKSKPTPPELLRYATEGAEQAGLSGLCWALQAMAARPDRTEMVKALQIPILVAHGNEDQIVPFEKARSLAEACQNPLFLELRAAHATPLEAPDQLAQGLFKLVQLSSEMNGQQVSGSS